MVSSASTTGAKNTFGESQAIYFDRIAKMNLKAPQIVGFGISNKETFQQATKNAKGAIVGSAFVKFIGKNPIENIPEFVKTIIS